VKHELLVYKRPVLEDINKPDDIFGNIKTPCNRVFYFFLGIVVSFSIKS